MSKGVGMEPLVLERTVPLARVSVSAWLLQVGAWWWRGWLAYAAAVAPGGWR